MHPGGCGARDDAALSPLPNLLSHNSFLLSNFPLSQHTPRSRFPSPFPRSSIVKYMRSVKKVVLRLVETFVDKCEDPTVIATMVRGGEGKGMDIKEAWETMESMFLMLCPHFPHPGRTCYDGSGPRGLCPGSTGCKVWGLA